MKVKKLYSRCHLGRRCPHLEFARWSSDLPDPSVRREERVPIPDEWTTVFSDPRLCKAVIERLTYRSHIVETGTDSYRFKRSLSRLKGLKSTTSAKTLAAGRAVEAQKEDAAMSDTADSPTVDTTLSGLTTSEVSSPETSTTAPAGGAR